MLGQLFKTHKKTKPKPSGQNGFSIIEVVITMFIVGITLVLFEATANSLVLNKYGRYKEIALRIADKKMQTIRTTAFASIPASGTFSDSQLSQLPNGQASITTSDISTTLKDVTVTITWTKPSGLGTQQMELQTYVSSVGLGQ